MVQDGFEVQGDQSEAVEESKLGHLLNDGSGGRLAIEMPSRSSRIPSIEQAQTPYVQHVESVRAAFGDAAADAVRAMASFRYAQLTTLALIEELDRANILAPGVSETIRHLWATAQSQTSRIMLAPLLQGLDDEDAAELVIALSEVAKILTASPFTERRLTLTHKRFSCRSKRGETR